MKNNRYPNDADYTTNAPSYYDDLARKQKLIELLSKRIWEYDEELAKRFEAWDQNLEEFDDEVIRLLVEWLEDGTLEQIINHDVLGNKADQSELDKTNTQLDKTSQSLNDIYINVKNPPSPLVSAKGDGVTNDTQAIQNIINYVHSQRPNLDKRLRVFIPSGIYLVNQIKLPSNTNLYGGGRDNTTIKQVSGELKDLIIDDEETGAYSIRIMDLRLDGNGNSSNGFNLGFHQPPSGYEFGMVWGVEGRMERVMVRNFLKTGFRVRSSVTSMEDVIAINCGIGFAFYGGSLVATHLIGHDCDKFIEFRGAGHKLFGVHYESGSDKTEPLIDFYNNSTDNIIHDITVQINASRTIQDFIRIQTPSFGNRIKDIKIQGIQASNINTFVNDLQARDEVKHIISSYEQNVRKPIVNVDETDLTNLSYRIYPETANVHYSYIGSTQSAVFLMPRVSLTGIEVTISNNTEGRLRVNAHELDSGNNVFSGRENVLYIPPKGMIKLVSNGSHFMIERSNTPQADNSGTITIPVGSNEVSVTHHLGQLPKIMLATPSKNIGHVWTGDSGTGQFKIYCENPVTEDTLISWFARL